MDEKRIQLTLRIPKSKHDRVVKAAAPNGQSLTWWVNKAIDEKLTREAAK